MRMVSRSTYAQEPVESTGLSINARRVALDVLCDVHQNGAYASLTLDDQLRAAKLSPEDRRLVTSIVYGTLENEMRIDYALDQLMEHPTQVPVQRDILRMSAYQILFLDRVPDSAAVNEAVKIVKSMDMESASGFINAVLRNLVRGKEEMEWPKREDDLREYLHIMGSMPMWIVDKLIAAYGEEEAERIVMFRDTEHPLVLRPNLARLTDTEFEALLEKKAWRCERALAPHAYFVYGASEITFDRDYIDGLFSIQGQSSMLAAEAVGAKVGMKILDACAAPGGKSAYLCESMQMTGRVYAWELHEKRTLL
ncbi:MAG: transcription antitermination factor NusB, partial [Clostridia bacterium]